MFKTQFKIYSLHHKCASFAKLHPIICLIQFYLLLLLNQSIFFIKLFIYFRLHGNIILSTPRVGRNNFFFWECNKSFNNLNEHIRSIWHECYYIIVYDQTMYLKLTCCDTLYISLNLWPDLMRLNVGQVVIWMDKSRTFI